MDLASTKPVCDTKVESDDGNGHVNEYCEVGNGAVESVSSLLSKGVPLQQLPPVKPALIRMEEEAPTLSTEVELLTNSLVPSQCATNAILDSSPKESHVAGVTLQSPTTTEPVIQIPSATPNATTVGNGLQQIMTRKRSSLSAAANGGIPGNAACIAQVAPATVISMVSSTSLEGCKKTVEKSSNIVQPPKKKKKYTPKPRKTVPLATPDVQNGTKVMANPMTEIRSSTTAEISTTPQVHEQVISTETGNVTSKPKRPSKPKAAKKSGTTGSNKSNSKKGKQVSSIIPIAPPVREDIKSFERETEKDVRSNIYGSGLQQLVPPLKIHMPKLTKMPPAASNKRKPQLISNLASVSKVKPKEEPQDWEENGIDPLMLADTELNEDTETGNGKGTRKKKSKGRNGNIYIGVFNRIEWMKLQNEFGFGSVNNFGTFVLQTMRRVHGDIQFWCDVAEGSGVYTELDHYQWTNGFPHAVNKDGQYFTPEFSGMSDEKRDNVIEMAKGMWDQRLQKLKQQQESVGEEEVILDGGAEDVEEEDEDVMPGLENYLENMASGQYSHQQSSEHISEEEVNKVWSEQMTDTDTLERYGKLFSFINGIEANGERLEQEKMEEGQEEKVQEHGDLDVKVV